MALNYPRKVLVGLLGAPIAHSASPAMHEAAAAAAGFRAWYHLIEVAGADDARLRRILDGIRDIGFAGINVTFPYKERIVPLLDGLADGVAAIGAVNTIVVRDGRLIGHNTDCSGFAAACASRFGPLAGKTVAIIGAGGVGKAVGFALARLGVGQVTLFDRDARKAEALRDALATSVPVTVCDGVARALDGADGVVNGTPIGMLPDRGTPIPFDRLHAGLWVADAVYQPLWTPLLMAAREAGAPVMTGRDLAIRQALDSFALFTGVEGSEVAMSDAFDRIIAARNETADAA